MGAAAIALTVILAACILVVFGVGFRATRFPKGDPRRNRARYVYLAMLASLIGIPAVAALVGIAIIAIVERLIA